jgi:hypothetical protein
MNTRANVWAKVTCMLPTKLGAFQTPVRALAVRRKIHLDSVW